MLIETEGEVCVCEMTYALEESQPKISRHLALMREAGLVQSRREGTWMHYRVSTNLPGWSRCIIRHLCGQLANVDSHAHDRLRLQAMDNRPDRVCA